MAATDEETARPDIRLVRVKPYDEGRGHVVRRYNVGGRKFDAEAGWYEVPTAIATMLRQFRQRDDNPRSPRVFDVCTAERAAELAEYERRLALAAAGIAQVPMPPSMADVARPATPRKSDIGRLRPEHTRTMAPDTDATDEKPDPIAVVEEEDDDDEPTPDAATLAGLDNAFGDDDVNAHSEPAPTTTEATDDDEEDEPAPADVRPVGHAPAQPAPRPPAPSPAPAPTRKGPGRRR